MELGSRHKQEVHSTNTSCQINIWSPLPHDALRMPHFGMRAFATFQERNVIERNHRGALTSLTCFSKILII